MLIIPSDQPNGGTMNAGTEATGQKTLKPTKRTVDALTCEGVGNGARYAWDFEIKGFAVRIYPAGRKAFLVAYRAGNRKRSLTLGTFGKDLTADEARNLAIAALEDVVRGADPAEVREQKRQGETMRRDLRTLAAMTGRLRFDLGDSWPNAWRRRSTFGASARGQPLGAGRSATWRRRATADFASRGCSKEAAWTTIA